MGRPIETHELIVKHHRTNQTTRVTGTYLELLTKARSASSLLTHWYCYSRKEENTGLVVYDDTYQDHFDEGFVVLQKINLN
jgi:hypothetical protein